MPLQYFCSITNIVNRFLISFIILLSCFCGPVSAQTDTTIYGILPTDSIAAPDSALIRDSLLAIQMADSFSRQPVVKDTGWTVDPGMPLYRQVMEHHPYFGFAGKPLSKETGNLKQFEGKELLFYFLLFLLLVFAFFRLAFPKYFSDLFRLFFRTTLKQRQIREQLMQTPLPSLLLNGFFVVAGGLYIDFMLLHFRLIEKPDFWLFFLYGAAGLSVTYFVKFIGLKILGWIFNLQEAADSYIFIVFIINKVIGVFLLPFLIMLAFMQGNGYLAALVISWTGIGILLLYRFILTYSAVRNQVKFNPFHFFLYLCAFEIAPLLLIYKLLLVFFR